MTGALIAVFVKRFFRGELCGGRQIALGVAHDPLLPPIVQTVGRSLDPLSAPPSLGVVRAGKQTIGDGRAARSSLLIPLGWARPPDATRARFGGLLSRDTARAMSQENVRV